MSARSRLVAAGRANGEVDLLQVTSQRRLVELKTEGRQNHHGGGDRSQGQRTGGAQQCGPQHLGARSETSRSDAGDALLCLSGTKATPAPAFVWQSSSGTDDFEPKLSLIPLIFGTLKATFYSLLFGVPVALLAAVYASEFMTKRVRGRIKPAIELMAGLPSVVLGFLAALVLAPLVERWLPAVLASFVTVPLVLLLGAFFWQLWPERVALRLAPWRFVFVLLVMPLGVLLGNLECAAARAIVVCRRSEALAQRSRARLGRGWLDDLVHAALGNSDRLADGTRRLAAAAQDLVRMEPPAVRAGRSRADSQSAWSWRSQSPGCAQNSSRWSAGTPAEPTSIPTCSATPWWSAS